LLPHYHQLLAIGSGISPDVMAERGYWSDTDWRELDGLNFRGAQ
jgi:hypothetical protein